ncbi:hypothetical protein [Georgenia ruanii]|nr:hypothetical protein [Georgenia ruanii]
MPMTPRGSSGEPVRVVDVDVSAEDAVAEAGDAVEALLDEE